MQGLKIISLSGESISDEEIVAAHRAANAHKKQKIGVIEITDPINDIVVRYHAYNNTAFTRGGNSIYFGYGEAVDMRCWCKGVIFAEAGFGTDNYRSAAFLTDGTELASVATSIAGDSIINAFNAYGNNVNYWGGASYAAIFDFLDQGGSNEIIRKPNLEFIVPDDACFTEGNAPFYPGSYDYVVTPEWQAEWDAGQLEGLARERARRRKCSDGQLSYLRNGFLSPEFEYFIKTQHPVSALVRRDIPMEVVSGPTYTLLNDPGLEFPRIYEYTGTITLKYIANDSNGSPIEHIKTLSGNATVTENRMHLIDGTPSGPNWYIRTYTDFPMLSSQSPSSGDIYYPNTHALGLNPINFQINDPSYLMSGLIISDDHVLGSSILSVLNGNWTTNKLWNVTNQWFNELSRAAMYSPGYDAPPTSATIKYTHPQFLLDYIAVSKPVEIDPDNPEDLASTNWLSSRLSHDEVVTVVPLSFVNADGDDRGIYPYPQTSLNQEVIAQIKLVGFAKFKFNYFTSSFAFVSWTELTTEGDIKHDGNATYDDETNPTSVTVGETTYTLQPKYIDYDPEFGSTNCVCIGNKAIWTDVKADAQEQKINIADTAPEGHALTAEERLYKAVREALM